MAKKIALVLVLVLLASMLAVVFVGCGKREETLRIYNWGEYMPEEFTESRFADFKAWYKEKTGKNINVEYEGKAIDVGMDIFSRGLCLPSDNKMTVEEQKVVIDVIKACFD